MKKIRPYRSTFSALVLMFLLSSIYYMAVPPRAQGVSNTLVISQVYGGGGNSGAIYKNDFVEIFNRGTSTINVSGWSVQYAASTGTSWQKVDLSGSIAPGQYYLIQLAAGSAGTTDLPTPDATGTIAMAATAGKVALVNSTTVLSGSCPADTSIVDLVGYGSTANCFEGTAPTPAPSNTNAVVRASDGCTDTDNNGSDFSAAAANPRNSASPLKDCAALPPTNPTASGSANPAAVTAGNSTLLTVTVTPGTNPTSTGITVTGNLTAIGGTATQSFFDDGTNGDATAGDRVFSYQATVAAGTTGGNKSLPITVSDAQARSASTTITVTVQAPSVTLSISAIQGSGTRSAYAGQTVTTTGIVTAVKTNGFFMQSATPDADPNTSEGLFVFTGSPLPAGVAVGNALEVTGNLIEFSPSSDPLSPPLTEISGGVSVTLISTGNPLPAPVTITAADTSPTGALEQLEKYENMRVRVDSLTTVTGTTGFVSEANATGSSNGVFFAVVTGVARPFREPGIEAPDSPPSGSPCCIPIFDANPERLRVDSDGQVGALRLEVTSGATVTNVVGVLDYGSRTYTILPDPSTPPSVSGNITAIPVPVPTANQFTVASINMQRLFDTVNDPSTGDPVLTATAFENRLNKISLAIRNVMRTPDIIGVQEVENLTTLQALADRLNQDSVNAGQSNPRYLAFLEEGNDPGGIDVGFLVKSARVNVVDVVQVGKDATYIDPNSGTPDLLNDRPSLVLRAVVMPGTTSQFAVTVINNHLRSLNGVDDPVDGNRVRTKRRAQAEYLANLIQSRQQADASERIVSIGDYNAFQFNDGFVDVIGTIKGAPTPADQVVLASADLVNPNLIDLGDSVPSTQHYSYLFGGNAQELDHVLVTGNMLSFAAGLNYPRNNADFPEIYRSDATRPERFSDHESIVAFFNLPSAPAPAATATSVSSSLNPSTAGQSVTFTATVTSSGAPVTQGTVTFKEGATVLAGPVTLSASGTASFSTTSLSAGSHTITAEYSGTASFTASSGNVVQTVNAPPTGGITLTATGYKSKGLPKVDLRWSGANGASIDVFRNGVKIVTTENDQFYTDNLDKNATGTFRYKICEAGTGNCSNEATATIR